MGVTWDKLSLSGFGLYRDSVTVRFAPGINVCIGGNEQGKSTLAAGVAAIIYGLPADSNPKMFGQERFRNWLGPARFEGDLEFTVQGDAWRLRRNFDTHRISLQQQAGGQWEEVVGGEHNPQARRPNKTFQDKITGLFGIWGRELFMSTFFVTQPIPESAQMIPEIQQLLSGSGGHFRDALKILVDELKSLTRYTGRAGVTNRDMNQDRRLEKLDAELAEITREIQKSEGTLQELQEVASALRQKSWKRTEARALLTERGRLLEAWRKWRTLRDRYQDALAGQGTLADAGEQASALWGAIREKESRLSAEFALYAPMSPETGEDLAELTRLFAAEEQLQAEVQQAASEAVTIEEELTKTQQRLDTYAEVRGRPALVRDCLELGKLVVREKEIKEAEEKARERLTSEKRQLNHLSPFDNLGNVSSQAIVSLQNAAGRVLGDWRSFRRDLERLAELENAISSEYKHFSEADEHLLDLLSNYESTRFRLEKRLTEAQGNLDGARKQTSEVAAAKEEFARLYGDLDRLGDDGPSRIDEKTSLLEQKEREGRAVVPEGAGALRVFPVTFFGALAAGGFVYATTQNLPAAVLALAGTGILAFFLLRGKADRQQRAGQNHRLTDITNKTARLDQELGPFATLGATGLGELRQRLRQRGDALQRLQELTATMPAENILTGLADELSAAQSAHGDFFRQTAAAAASVSDLSAAYRTWQELAREADGLSKQTADFARRYGNQAKTAGLFARPAESLPDPWPDLLRLAKGYGDSPETVAEALYWLESRDNAWWTTVKAETEVYEKQAAALREAELELRAYEGPEQQKRLENIAREVAALRQLTEPYNECSDTDALQETLKDCAAAEEDLLRQQAALAAAKEKKKQLEEKGTPLAQEKKRLTERLALILSDNPDPEHHQKLWRAAEEIRRAGDQEEKKLAGILAAYGAATVEVLRSMASDTSNRAIAAFQEWEKLVSAYPSLPGTNNADPVALEAAFRELETDVGRLQGEEERMHEEIRELELRLARLQGNTPLNIAAGNARLRELSGERDRLKREVAALQAAYLEMAAAVDDFSLSYREAFATKASEYFAGITGVAGRAVTMNEEFCVAVVEDGKSADIAQLSQGARDQLYVSLRLAIADQLAGDAAIPFIFDDPFLNWDQERTEQIRKALAGMEETRQVLLLSHREEFSDWGKPCRKEI